MNTSEEKEKRDTLRNVCGQYVLSANGRTSAHDRNDVEKYDG